MVTNNWVENKGNLIGTFEFKNFREAFSFVSSVGNIAENQNHHPDICIYDYNKVRLTLSTHETGSVTQKDRKLAREINRLLNARK